MAEVIRLRLGPEAMLSAVNKLASDFTVEDIVLEVQTAAIQIALQKILYENMTDEDIAALVKTQLSAALRGAPFKITEFSSQTDFDYDALLVKIKFISRAKLPSDDRMKGTALVPLPEPPVKKAARRFALDD